MTNEELLTVRGYVQALPKEENCRVAVFTDDGDEYHVFHKAAGMDLADFISAEVEVQGFVSPLGAESTAVPVEQDPDEAPGRVYCMVVRSYRLTDDFDEPW